QRVRPRATTRANAQGPPALTALLVPDGTTGSTRHAIAERGQVEPRDHNGTGAPSSDAPVNTGGPQPSASSRGCSRQHLHGPRPTDARDRGRDRHRTDLDALYRGGVAR